ncbi:MAG TPA: MBL fold metallo-hydrolase [Nostocaceae cyanobacterium]|nr:MBL fold metallo-hydrolase [Nostocaceae cyanobacterium]
MYFTWFDANSWLWEIGGQKILIDPWLVGSLTFFNLEWLVKGDRPQDRNIPENIDLILLSQGLQDHAHPPTLKRLNRNIPVVASVNAAKVVKELGYTNVTALTNQQTFTLNHQVEITALPGTSLGPTVLENGYLLKELVSNTTIYYEPHGNHSPQIKQLAPVDIIVTPIKSASLPVVGNILKGMNSTLEVAKWLQPRLILPTAEDRDIVYEGFLSKILRINGSVEEFQTLLTQNNLPTKIINPTLGERTAFF